MKKTLLLIFVLFLASTTYGQKITLDKGKLDFLKGQKSLKVEYVYDGMKVGRDLTEEEYLSERVKKYNEQERKKGDNWLRKWKNDRENKYEPKFESLLNKYLKEKKVSIYKDETDTKYTLILKTTYTEPGFQNPFMKKDALINVEIIFVETINHDNIIAKIIMKKIPGKSLIADYNPGTRIGESYAKCGKSLAKYLLKQKVF